MRRRKILWTMGLSGLALLIGALTFGMNAAYGGLAGGYYAYSPILEKFVDNLPGVGFNNRSTTLQTYIPIATKVTNSFFPNDDYYELGITDGFRQRMHSSLPAPGTLLRGYIDLGVASPTFHYLGPIIIAQRDKPVRIKMSNMLDTSTGPSGGKLQIPTDYLLMGAGAGPSGGNYTQNRASTHLHGGLPPWISDGTALQWNTPNGETNPYTLGASFRNVPDMWFAGAGFVLIVVTNQPDVARGAQPRAVVEAINRELRRQVSLDDIMVCYHDGADNCPCRKPEPGMLLEAASIWSIDLQKSFMVGDRWTDIESGWRAGCRTVLVNAAGPELRRCLPDFEAASLVEAVPWIVRQAAIITSAEAQEKK